MRMTKQGVRDLSKHVNARKIPNQALCIHEYQHHPDCHCRWLSYDEVLSSPCLEQCKKCKKVRQ